MRWMDFDWVFRAAIVIGGLYFLGHFIYFLGALYGR